MAIKDPIAVSLIITAHHEGLILHKTILSILSSSKHLDQANIPYEIILNLDNADDETKRCANIWKDDERFVIDEVSFGNPADNRNDAVKKARGKYVSILDGDDLITEKWLIKAYNIAENLDKPAILRPKIHAQFGYEEENLTIWEMRDSSTKEEDAIQMSYWNLWTNAIFSQKSILLETPFKASKNGFGFEDYLFGADTRAKDIANLTVPETALFYRRRESSVSAEHAGTVLDYSDLFDVSFIKSIPVDGDVKKPSSSSLKKIAKHAYRFMFDTAKKIQPIERLLSPTARNLLYRSKSKNIHPWFIKEWQNINKIENQLWPTRGEVAKASFHPLTFDPYHNYYGQIYQKLCHSMSGDHLDYLFLAPAMSGRGGTEKLIANYIKALKKAHPSWKIGILSTHPFGEKVYEYFKDVSVDMLDFGSLTLGIGDYEKDIIWSRLFIQSKVKRIHVVNDEYWYKWISKHQKLLINNRFKIYISLFMREYVHEKGRVLSFADPDLVEIWPTVTKVLTDNERVIIDALENNAFEKDKMAVHYQPQDAGEMVSPKLIDNKKPIKILWASRISHQKRPDLVKKIAAKLGSNFTIDAYGLIEKKQYKATYFNDSKVIYRGNFNGLESLPTEKYDIYLYTSQTDGIPNILLEATSAGLPIIASDIGGINEYIEGGKSGYLVDMEDIDGYVKAIHQMVKEPKNTQAMANNLQNKLLTQHSWESFEESVKSTFQY